MRRRHGAARASRCGCTRPAVSVKRGAITSNSLAVASGWSILDMISLRCACESSRAIVTSFSTIGRMLFALASVVVIRSCRIIDTASCRNMAVAGLGFGRICGPPYGVASLRFLTICVTCTEIVTGERCNRLRNIPALIVLVAIHGGFECVKVAVISREDAGIALRQISDTRSACPAAP